MTVFAVAIAIAVWIGCGFATRRILGHAGAFWLGLILGPLGVGIAALDYALDGGQRPGQAGML